MPEQKRREVERRLAAEWMATTYEGKEYFLNYALGPLPAGITDMRLAMPWLRKVDGLAILDGTVHLVEFKVWTPLDGIDKLPVYRAAVPHTPWLGAAKDYPVLMRLVTPRSNPGLVAQAAMMGIEVVQVSGGWIDEVVKSIEWLWTKEGRESMAEKRRLRSWLGLE